MLYAVNPYNHFAIRSNERCGFNIVYNIQGFLCEQRAKADNAYTEELQSKLQRLKDQINWYDSFINAKDELLDEVNKSSLEAPRSNHYW